MTFVASPPPPSSGSDPDAYWMHQALALAQQAAAQGEVPVGAILVRADRVLAQGWNQPIARRDPTAHAEILALRQAAARLDNYRLPPQVALYVTLEPCVMCLGAIVQARVARVVYAASDPRAGAGTRFALFQQRAFNHQPLWQGGVLAGEAAHLLQTFFRARR